MSRPFQKPLLSTPISVAHMMSPVLQVAKLLLDGVVEPLIVTIFGGQAEFTLVDPHCVCALTTTHATAQRHGQRIFLPCACRP